MGKALSSNKTGFWRYRGDYRIICDIEDEVLVILVVEVNTEVRFMTVTLKLWLLVISANLGPTILSVGGATYYRRSGE